MFLAKKSLCPQKSQRFPMFLAKKTLCDIFHKKDGKSLTFFVENIEIFWLKTQEIFNFFEDIEIFGPKTCKISKHQK